MPPNTPLCDFGWKAPAFTLSDPIGLSCSLDRLMGEKGLLIAFICNHCPYVVAVIDRLVADAAVLKEEWSTRSRSCPMTTPPTPTTAPTR